MKKIKYLLLLLVTINAHAFSLPCPEDMMGPENLLTVQLKTGSGSSKIEGPAHIRFDECRVDFTGEEVIPFLKVKVDTDAKFRFKKKILFAKVSKTIDLKCSFKSTVNTKIVDGCNFKDTNFGFYRLHCKNIPRVFTKLIEKLIKKEIRKKGGNLIEEMFYKMMDRNEFLSDLCLEDS